MRERILLLGLVVLFLFAVKTTAQSNQDKSQLELFSSLGIDMQWFLSYLNGEEDGRSFNEFALKRGYVNIKKKINYTFSGRITTDITVDREGDGIGDVEIRLKYLYLKYQLPSFSIFNKPYLEFGLVHRPWLDFEQKINDYRVEGTMFLERNKVVNSGDYGIVFISMLGDEMDDNYKKNVNKSFAGTLGSISFGIFNGGGYHALEQNKNKSLEGRLTLRPLHKLLPGLQFTYHGALGKGNIPEAPDWNYNSFFISHEMPDLIFTCELYRGKGNYQGNAVHDEISFESVPQTGYSFFGELLLFNSWVSLFGRYDSFTQQLYQGDFITKRIIAGVAFHFIRGSKIVVDFDTVNYSNSSKQNSHIFEIAIELKY